MATWPVFLLGKFHGQRSLAGHSPRGRKASDATEHTHTIVKNQWVTGAVNMTDIPVVTTLIFIPPPITEGGRMTRTEREHSLVVKGKGPGAKRSHCCPIACQLCDFRHVTSPLWASISSSVKCKNVAMIVHAFILSTFCAFSSRKQASGEVKWLPWAT